MTNSSAGAGRDGKLREQVAQRLQDVASFNGCCGNHKDVTCIEAAPADPTFWCKYCVQGQAAVLLAVPDPLASDTEQESREIKRIRKFWNKPPAPTFCSACKKEIPVLRGPAPGMFSVSGCPHCGSKAGWTSTFTTGGRDAKDDINYLLDRLAPLASSSAPQGENK